LIAMMLSMVVCSPLGGRAAEWIGARAVVVLGTLTMLAGLLLLTRVGSIAAAADAGLALVLIGAGLGLASAPAQAAAITAVSRVQSGMAAGALSTMRYLGGIVGIGALGAILRDVAYVDPARTVTIHQGAIWLYCVVVLTSILPAALLPGHSLSGRARSTGSAAVLKARTCVSRPQSGQMREKTS
jgi:MFS family permease